VRPDQAHRYGVLFSDFFEVSKDSLEAHGAFNVSLAADLPLFIDPFLLFHSGEEKYQTLHHGMIRYLKFLRDKTLAGEVNDGLVRRWFYFSEVRQTWLGFSEDGNGGHGLGKKFANALVDNFHRLFGEEELKVTRGHHMEKLCLISGGVGRDCISDFTTNLIKSYLCEYTQEFARANIAQEKCRKVWVEKAEFDYQTQSWRRQQYDLPWFKGDYVLLVPKDILARDETWINSRDLVEGFESLPMSLPDEGLRAEIDNYFRQVLPPKPKGPDRAEAIRKTLLQFPELIDRFIKMKEDDGDHAQSLSDENVSRAQMIFENALSEIIEALRIKGFYDVVGDSLESARARVMYLKQVIENQDGYRLFWDGDKRILQREEDIHKLYKLTWSGSVFDVNAEVNNGRGPVDFKISHGSKDKCLVEFKLANNTQLKRQLQKQLEVYAAANDTDKGLKVIVVFTESEQAKLDELLQEIGLADSPGVIQIDARRDNKPSGSKA